MKIPLQMKAMEKHLTLGLKEMILHIMNLLPLPREKEIRLQNDYQRNGGGVATFLIN